MQKYGVTLYVVAHAPQRHVFFSKIIVCCGYTEHTIFIFLTSEDTISVIMFICQQKREALDVTT